MKVISLRN